MNTVLTLFRGYGLEGGNLLPHLAAFALWALESLLFIFRDLYDQGKGLTAFLTHELVCGHSRHLLLCYALDAQIQKHHKFFY